MAEEMMLEAWESDESEDSEADEALVEAEDSAEDIGERLFRRRPPQRRRSHFRPIRQGVGGMRVRGPDGRARRMPFPTPLATAAETNKGLATQEVGRRALEERMDRLETRSRVQRKNDTSATGIVSLVLSGGLSAWGAYQASQKSGTSSSLGKWADEEATRMAAVTSFSQIAMSGTKTALQGGYHRNAFGIAADVFSVAQLAAFAFGRLHTPLPLLDVPNLAALTKLAKDKKLEFPRLYVTLNNGQLYETTSASVFTVKK